MNVLKTYRGTNGFAILLLLCQILCVALSKTPNHNDASKRMITNHGIGRILEELIGFDFSAFEEASNSTRLTDDNVSGIQAEERQSNTTGSTANETNSNWNEQPKGLPVSDPNLSIEPVEEPEGLPVSGSNIPLETTDTGLSASIPVETTIDLQLIDTPSLMAQGQLEAFLDVTSGILSFYLLKGTFLPSKLESEGIEVELIQQTRSPIGKFVKPGQAVQPRNDDITQPLYVSLRVSGKIYEEDIEDANLIFDQALGKLFVEKEGEYLEALKYMDGDFFITLNRVNIVPEVEADIMPEIEAVPVHENEAPTFPEKETNETSFIQSIEEEDPDQGHINAPYKDTESFGSVEETKKIGGNDEIEGGVLSLGAIIGIVISGVIIFVLTAFVICWARKKKRNSNGSQRKMASPYKKTYWNQHHRLQDPVDSIANENLLGSDLKPIDKRSDVASSNDDLESQAMYSYNHSGTASVYTNGSAIRISDNNSYNFDSMSYAYSLEPGIEASVVEGMVPSDRSRFSNFSNGTNDLPIREITQVITTANEKSADVNRINVPTKKKEEQSVMYDHFWNTQIERAPSDLKLTKSELAMLPSNLRGSSIESESKLETRKIVAPAGKLGIVIDTSIEGPIVHSVSKGSTLFGKIFPGDIIVAIDDVDTRAMSSSAITAVMVRTADKSRNLTVQRSA